MEKYEVICLNLNDKSEAVLNVFADEYETDDEIVLSVKLNGEEMFWKGEYYFDTFKRMEDSLLEKGYALKCCGAMPNAVQSTMACYSDRIYLVRLGEQARKEDIAGIFDYADISEFCTSREQDAFFEEWTNSMLKG